MKEVCLIFLIFLLKLNLQAKDAKIWMKYEIRFESEIIYNNPIYDVKEFKVTFTSPSGQTLNVNGFWDGGKNWKLRLCPNEIGTWKWVSYCSDKNNTGLNNSNEDIYNRGAITHPKGKYYLTYNDGKPFFWLACTAWNGALKSNDEEWDFYLQHRKNNNYNVIQLVTTQWRGCEKNAEGIVAFEGSGYIKINPEFFKRIDQKIDEANEKGLVVSPVILWALPFGQGRHLSPGYTLPIEEAVLLARYIVARYQGNHVVWTLGGDGRYYGSLEDRWKEIGRQVFSGINHAPVTLHPHGNSWIGEEYAGEEWYDIMGYLFEFVNQYERWDFFPANELLIEQPGEMVYNHWISVVKTTDNSTIVAYIPVKGDVKLRNLNNLVYSAKWFNPVDNSYSDAKITQKDGVISFGQEFENDMLVVLTDK